MRPERRRARVSGGELSYQEIGEGPPLLLLHGFPTSSSLWRREALLLASRMRVIAPDLLGYGESDRPSEADITIGAQARYMRELLEGVGIGEFAVAGHEAGGGVAQLLALDPGVRALVLLDSVCFDAWPWEDVLALARADEDAQTPSSANGFVRRVLERGVLRRERLDDETVASFSEPWRVEPASLVRAARALDGKGLSGRERELGELDAPSFILWGEDDPFLPTALAERLGETIPGSTVALLPGCSHFVNLDAPHTVGPLVFEFLRYRYLGESHAPVDPRSVPVFLERPPDGFELPDEEP